MTGETAVFVSPAPDQAGALRGVGFGLLVEAKDQSVARNKLGKIMAALQLALSPTALTSNETINDVQFTRLPIDRDTSLFAGLVDQWVVLTSSGAVAADVIGAVRGRGSLASQAEFTFVRSRLPDREQALLFAAPPALLQLLAPALGAMAGETDEYAPYIGQVPALGIGIDFAPGSADIRYLAHLVIPDQPVALPRPSTGVVPRFRPDVSVLVDASKHGGAWWSDDEEPSPVAV